MKVAVISDIHANRQAFEATLEAVAASDAAELWCLGDLVGYGADPDACVELAREHAAVCLAGNHDLAVTGEIPLDEFSRGASLAAQWTREVIAPNNLEFLSGLRPQGEEGPIGLYHASPRDPVWEYVLSTLLAELCLDRQTHRICLVGHSHVALSFVRQEGELATGEPRREGTELDIAAGEWLLNPGSVGQPRDGDPRASWLLLDLDGLTASFKRTDYDIAGGGCSDSCSAPAGLARRAPGVRSMSMNRASSPTDRRSSSARRARVTRAVVLRVSFAAALGVLAALLVACSGSGKGLIPTGDAGPLQSDFEAVAQAAENGDGTAAPTESALLKTDQDFAALPASIDAGLHNTLRQGIENLRTRALALCAQPLPQATATTTPTTTSTTTTTTTPTETQTTSTQTTPTTTTPSPSGPGGARRRPAAKGRRKRVWAAKKPRGEGGTGGAGGAKVGGGQEGGK